MASRLFSGAAAGGGDAKARQTYDDMRRTNWFFTLFAGVGLAFVIAHKVGDQAVSITTALLWVLACSVSGAAVGFLFGIPKIFQGNGPGVEQAPGGSTAPAAAEGPDYRQQVNTNLTEISDWLTKIIVGLGLINLKEIPAYVGSMASALAGGLNPANPDAERGFAFGIITSFSVFGFLFGYIYTRVFIAVIFSRADREATAQINEVRLLAERAQAAAENAQTAALGVGKQQLSADSAMRAESPPGRPPDDPWKGKFGGSNRDNARLLDAEVQAIDGSPDLFSVCLKVSSTDPAASPLRGAVQFFLHPTFNNPRPVVKVGPTGVAELALTAWGAFTVGAVADDGKTRLELDLAHLEGAPEEFRNR
jgi:hypothetical protein